MVNKAVWSSSVFSEFCHFGEKADPLCSRLEAPIVAMSPAEGQKGRDCWAVDYSENRNLLKNFPSFETQCRLEQDSKQYIVKSISAHAESTDIYLVSPTKKIILVRLSL